MKFWLPPPWLVRLLHMLGLTPLTDEQVAAYARLWYGEDE